VAGIADAVLAIEGPGALSRQKIADEIKRQAGGAEGGDRGA